MSTCCEQRILKWEPGRNTKGDKTWRNTDGWSKPVGRQKGYREDMRR